MRLVGRELGITFSSGADGATGTVTGRVECVLPERLEERRPARHALWDLPDLALVRVLAPITHACVRLTDRGRPRLDEVAYFGCTEDLGAPEITGRTTRLRGTAGAGAALRLGSDDEIEPGMSGGPVVDLARGEVIGVVKARRHTGGGGIAVSVVQLRTLPLAATGQVGLYRRVMQAHDLYHYDQHLSDLGSSRTWTDVHDELPTGGDPYEGRRRLTPAELTTLCGLLAELPPPRSSEDVRALVEAARGEEPDPGLPAPLSWRDGLGMLHDPPGGTGEAAVMLRYATDVSVADHREPPPRAPTRSCGTGCGPRPNGSGGPCAASWASGAIRASRSATGAGAPAPTGTRTGTPGRPAGCPRGLRCCWRRGRTAGKTSTTGASRCSTGPPTRAG